MMSYYYSIGLACAIALGGIALLLATPGFA